MIRKELCAIAGMKIPTFNSHRSNGDLPFVTEDAEAKDGEGRSWSNFTIHDAARMLAARNLCDAHGVTWSEAARIMREPATACGPVGYGNHPSERAGIFVAQVEFANTRTNDDPQLLPRFQTYKGPLDKIIAAAQSHADAYTKRRNSGPVAHDEAVAVTSIVAVDLSHSYKIALALAEQLGIDVQADYAVEPDEAE